MGYAPVFDTVFDGTLCGKWPTLPVWLTLLPLADWRGHIDMTHQAIAARTGWPLDLLQKGIESLCQPDPDSRSPIEEGRRLVLLDGHRNWGWRIVNFELYRRKVKDANDVATGKAAERSKRYRERHAASRLVTPGHDTHTHTHTHTNPKSKSARKRATRVPEDFSPDLEYARAQVPDIDAEREAQKFRDWEYKTPRSDWAAAWRTWVHNCRDNGKYARRALSAPVREAPVFR